MVIDGLPKNLCDILDLDGSIARLGFDSIFEHRHAKRAADGDGVGATLDSLGCPAIADSLIGGFFHEAEPSSSSATVTSLARARHFNGIAADRDLDELPRSIVLAVVSSQVAWVVESDGLVNGTAGLQTAATDEVGQECAVVLNLERPAKVWVLICEGVEAMRAGGDDLGDTE